MSQWASPWNAPKPQVEAVIEPTPVVEAAPAPTQTPEPVVEAPVAEDLSAKKTTKKVEPTQAE